MKTQNIFDFLNCEITLPVSFIILIYFCIFFLIFSFWRFWIIIARQEEIIKKRTQKIEELYKKLNVIELEKIE